MSINLASRLSAITTDFAGINHIVWVEDSAIWHAQFDANAGTWVNAQRVVEGVTGNVTALNLVANPQLIGSGSSATPGLAVIWQDGAITENGSNFYYSAANYGSTGQLQWAATPTALTVNETQDGLPFANLAPQAIADNNGNITIVGQQVNILNAANQAIREDTDLYTSSLNITDLTPGTSTSPTAFYAPPTIVNGVNQGPGIPLNQSSNTAQSASPTNAAPMSAQGTSFSASASVASQAAEPSTSSSNGFQGLGFQFGPSLSFTTDFIEALGLNEYLFGIPRLTVERTLKQYELVGTLSGTTNFSTGIELSSEGEVVRNPDPEIEYKNPWSVRPTGYEKKEGSFVSFAYESKSVYDYTSPYDLVSIEDSLTLSDNHTIPLLDKPAGLIAGNISLTGSLGIGAQLTLEPINPSTGDNNLLSVLSFDLAADGLTILLTGVATQLFGDKNDIAAALIASAVFAPIENLLLGNLIDASNLKVTDYLVGPTLGLDVKGQFFTDLFPVLKFNTSGGITLLFGFGEGGDETTELGIPLSTGVSLGPLQVNISIDPTWIWPSNPPLPNSSSTEATASSVAPSSVAVSASSATSTPTASVAGSLLTLNFDAPLDTSSLPDPSDFTLSVPTVNPNTLPTTVGSVLVSNDSNTGNGVVVLQLSQPIAYSPQFTGTNPQPNGQAAIEVSYTGTDLEYSDNTAVSDFSDLSVTNNSPQSLAVAFNPTSGNGNDYTVGDNQASFLGSLEADYAQDSPPALTLVSSSSTSQGQVLAVWSREVQPLTPIAGFVNGDQAYLNFVQGLNTSSTPSDSQFTVSVVSVNGNTSSVLVQNVAIYSGGYIQLNLSQAVASGDAVTITYQPSTTNQTDNLYLTDAVSSQLWIPTFSESLTNTTAPSSSTPPTTPTAPTTLGGAAIVDNSTTNNLITLIFDGLLDSSNIPNGSQFTLLSNGQTYSATISNVAVSGNTVTFNLPAPTNTPLISQGDIVTLTYTPSTSSEDQNLISNNGTAVGTFTTQLTTVPENPTTTLMAGFYTPESTGGLTNFQNIPGSDSLNFDPAVASDTSGNALAVWVYANTSDIDNLAFPGQFYTDDQSQVILDNLNQSDIYFSYWNGSQWTIAAPLATNQPGTDTNVTISYDSSSKTYIAAWLNTNNSDATIYWASYDPSTSAWSAVNQVLSEATPDPLTDLVIGSVNGQPTLFWTETQPVSYSQLTQEENPSLYLRLGELSGTTAKNSGNLGDTANGIYNGSVTLKEAGALFDPTTQSGDPNPAALFANGGSVTLNSALNTSGSAFSVEFWFKIPSAVSATTNLVDLAGVFSVVLNDDGTLTFGLDNSSSITTSASTNPFATDTWYYVVGTYSNLSQELSLYLNGQPVQTLDSVSFTLPANAALTLAGGTDAVYLDEVALYGKALSYSAQPTSGQNITGLNVLDTMLGTDQIGGKYSTQYVPPLPPGPQTQYSTLNTDANSWNAQTSITPIPFLQPTQLSDANIPVVDVVSSTTPNSTGNIYPNGQQDTVFKTTINGFQGKTIESISLQLSNGTTYSVGGSNTDNQLGVVIGDSLINSPAPNATFAYPVMGASLTLDLLVDTGADPSVAVTASSFQITFTDGTTASNTLSGSDKINLPTFVPPSSVPLTPGNVPTLGTATVTETEDSSLTLIDSGFVINTTNPGMGYAVVSADFNNDGKSDVAVGNRGYSNTSGTVTTTNDGTVQILMGGQSVLLDSSTSPLAPPTSSDSSSSTSGNIGGFAIVGIPDEGQPNGQFPLSMATGDVNNDGYIDLVIGSPNNSTVYVIYGSYLASSSAETVIDVANLTSTQGYTITSPNGTTSGDKFGFAVAVGNFNGTAGADIAIGAPNASNNGQGEVYVDYDGLASVSTIYTGSSYTNSSTNQTIGEQAGYALATSGSESGGASSFSGSTSTDDLIIGAPSHTIAVNNTWTGLSGLPTNNPNPYSDSTPVNVGAVYVFTSSSSGLASSPSYTYLGTDAATPSANGAAQPLLAGLVMTGNGDWDGDGSKDLAIAAPAGNSNSGVVYILSGATATTGNSQYLNQVSNLTINGGLPLGQAGAVVTPAGDVNDDNYLDLLITAPQGANGTGQGYVIFGNSELLGGADGTTILDLNVTASDNKATFLLNGHFPYQLTGQAATPIGDINDDGVDDLMITAPNANQLYAVYGHPWLADEGSIKLADISGDNGFVIDGDLYSATVGTQIYNLGDESSAAPAFINNNGTFYLAYVEKGGNQIYLTTSSDAGQTWTSAVELPSGITTSQSPSLAFYKGTLYLAYVGTNEQINITSSTDNGQSWSSQYKIDQFSGAGVSLVVYQDQLMAFFVGTESSSDILYVYSDNPQSGASWSTDYTVANPGGGTSSPNQTASQAVSATVMGETLYLAYQGGTVGSGNNYYVTNTSGSNLTNLTWSVSELSGATNSNTAPGITNDGSQLYFTYSNSSSDLYYLTSSNGTSWSGLNEIINQYSNDLPAPAILGGRLYLGYTGTDSEADVYVTALSGSQILLGAGNDVVMLGDINGDGFADVLAGGSINGAVVTFGASTQDLLDAAAGTDELIINIADGGLMQSVEAAGDFNGDGLADFGVVDQNNNFYLILGNANLGPQQTLTLSTSANIHQTGITSAVAVEDYNGDGYDDLLLSSSNGRQTLYKGNSSGALNSSVTFGANSNTVFNGIGDVNGDGFGDIGGGEPNGNVISPNATGNGQATVYSGNISANSASSNSTNITPPSAAIPGTLDNSDWSFNGLSEVPNSSPSFAVFNGYLYMVYNTANLNPNTDITTYNFYIQRSADGYNWEGLTNLGSNFESDTQASLAVFNNTLYLAFTATNNLVIVTPATTDSSSDLGLTFDSTNSINAGGNKAPTGIGPTLAVYDGELYLFFAANNTTQTILYTTSSDGSTWSSNGTVTDSSGNAQETGSRLGVAVDENNNNLLVSFIGNGNDDVNVATYNGTSWSSSEVSGQSSSAGPNLLSVGDTLYLFFTSSNKNDEILYLTSTDGGSTWSSTLNNIPSQTTYDRPSPVFFQESILVGYETTGTTRIGIATSNPIYEPNQTQQFGEQLQNIGDFNGDGIADFAVLAPGFFSNLGSWNNNLLENNQGAVLIYYGSTSGLSSSSTPDVVLATPAPNSSTNVANNQALLLTEFAPTGDINGDGYDDLIIASPNTALNSNNTTDGVAFVVFGGGESLWGSTYSATSPFNLGNLTPDISQLTLYFSNPLNEANVPATSAFAVKSGLNSITVKSISFNNPNELTLVLDSDANTSDFLSVVYTAPSSGTALTYAAGTNVKTFTASNDATIATLGAPIIESETYPQYGFSITGLPDSQAGISLDGGGDVNGDGFSDFIIGAPGDSDNLTYTIFGSDFNNTTNQTGTIGNDVMQGSPTGESFVAGQGNDLIITGGGTDVVYAGPGDDQVMVNDTYFRRLDGGTGLDVLFFQGYNGQDWDLTTLSPGTRLRNFEILVTENYGANTLTLNSLTVTQLSDNNTVTVVMDQNDTLNLSPDFSLSSNPVYQYNQKFDQYTSNTSAATVLLNRIPGVTETSQLVLTEAGSLVLLSSSGEQLWTAEQNGVQVKGADQALMQANGNFVLYDQVQPTNAAISIAGYLLGLSDSQTNSTFNINIPDGVLFLLNPEGSLIWQSDNTTRAVQALMQSDGYFVLYDQSQPSNKTGLGPRAVWSAGTTTASPEPVPGSFLSLAEDGGLYIVNPSTSTSDPVLATLNQGSASLTSNVVTLGAYDQITPSIALVNGYGEQFVLWSSGTWNNPDAYLQLGGDGGLYIKNSSGQVISTLNSGNASISDPTRLNEQQQLLGGDSLSASSRPNLIDVTKNAPSDNTPENVDTSEITASSVNAQMMTSYSVDEPSNQTAKSFASSVFSPTASNPNAPTRIFVSNPKANEADGKVDFTLTRTGNLDEYVWVDYYTKDGDAKAGDRYTPVAGQAVFTPGETTLTVTVPIPNNGKYVGTRQFGLAVTVQGESTNAADVPDAWQTAISTPNEQIRRWTLVPGEDGDSVVFDITSNHSPNRIVTMDMALDGMVIPLIFNPTTQTYENLPFSNVNGITQFQDINGDVINDLYRLNFQDGGPFDKDSKVNSLISLDFKLAQLEPIEVPTTGGIIQGTQGNDYLNAQASSGTNRLEGLGGIDVLIGSPQRDVLSGGDGNDQLFGYGQVDKLFGDAGDDLLDGGAALDFLYGGTGADNFVLRAGDGPDRVMDFNAAEGDLFLLDSISFGALSFKSNQILLGTDTLAIAIDSAGKPITDFANHPQWFVTI